MEIIFVILKAIGILLAILLLLCVTLFVVPVRYRVSITMQEETEGKAAIHWLLHLLDVRIYYKEKKVSYKIRIFGIPIPLGQKKNGEGKGIKKREKEKNSSGKQESPEGLPQELPLEESHPAEKEGSSGQGIAGKESALERNNLGKENAFKQEILEKENTFKQEILEKESSARQGALDEDTPQNGGSPTENGVPAKDGTPNRKDAKGSGPKSVEKSKDKKTHGNKGFAHKIKSRFNKRKHKPKPQKQQGGGTEGGRLASLKAQFQRIKEMVSEETNQAAFFHALREIRYLLRHYIPGTVSGNLTFSMGNPELTGKALGGLSLLPFWARSRMVVMPDFLSESFYAKGILYVAGHIRFLHLPVLGIRLLADKNIRKLIRDIRSQLQ